MLRSLKTDKASGPDGIPPRFLKEFADELAPVLCHLFRLILISCTYPSSWKHALVQSVPKKGDCSNPSNYRPIALTSAVAKVFETLLNSHFIKHLESNNLLLDHQYGFRKARSTGDLLSYLTHVWSSSLKNFGESFVVALDISKAFDRVWHKALLAKLPAYDFTPFCKLISSFLSNRFISVVVDGATSASFLVSSGVPQGSVLSPILFLLFINDLLHATASDVHSFADDSNLHKSSSFQCQPSSNARSQSRLAMSSTINSNLQSISEWGTRNLVKFNTSKTQLLTISLSNTPSNYPIIFEDSEIPSLNSVNILGLQISSSLSWRDHIVQIAKSASKKLGVLFRCKQYFNSAQLFKLYTGFIRPCLEYCSHIWGSSPYTSLLNRIEKKKMIKITYIKFRCPPLKKVHYFLDGCAGQYKNRYNFTNLCYHKEDFGVSCEWHFFATFLGKNACDGIGGRNSEKSSTARATLQRTIEKQILTPEHMFQFCEENLSKEIKCFFVTTADLKDTEELLKYQFKDSRAIPGTQKYHIFVPLNKEELMVYPTVSGIGENKRIRKSHFTIEPAMLGNLKCVKRGEYVGCIYNMQVWYGIGVEYCKKFEDYALNFLHLSGSSASSAYYYPSNKDSCAVPAHHILTVMICPILKGGSRIQYIFPQKEMDESIEHAKIVLGYHMNCLISVMSWP